MVAPEGGDEEVELKMNCEAADVDLDIGDIEHMNEDSLLAELSGDEQGASTLEEKFPLFGQEEQFGDEETPEHELSLAVTTPQLDVSAFT